MRMGIDIPGTHTDLLHRPIVCALATILPSGQPQVHPVWFGFQDGLLLINTARGRVKDHNLRANDRASVLVVDPDNPFRWLEIRARVAEVIEGGYAETHIDELSERYMGQPYPLRRPGEVRVLFRLRPERVMAFGGN